MSFAAFQVRLVIFFDVALIARGEAEREHGTLAGPEEDQRPKIARLPRARSGDPLLNQPADEVAIDKTPFRMRGCLAELNVRGPFALSEPLENFVLVNLPGVELPLLSHLV